MRKNRFVALLYLLQEHAGIEAKIEIPEAWQDPRAEVSGRLLINYANV